MLYFREKKKKNPNKSDTEVLKQAAQKLQSVVQNFNNRLDKHP